MNEFDKIKNLFLRFKDLTSMGVANSIATIIMGLFWFYLAPLLGSEEYGKISFLVATGSLIYIISMVGAGPTITVFTSKEKKSQSTIFFIPLIISLILSIVIFLIFYNIGISLFIIGSVIFALTAADLLGKKQYQKFSIFVIIQKILLLTFSLILYHIIGNDGIILGFGLSLFVYSIYLIKILRPLKFKISTIKEKISFMINAYSLDLSRTFTHTLDKIVIVPLFGYEMLGNYHLGYQVFIMLNVFSATVYAYILPQDASGNKKTKLKKITLIISVILALLGIFIAPLILPQIFPQFSESIEIVKIMSITVIPMTINYIYQSKFLGNNQSKIILYASILYITVQISLIFYLGQIFGIIGAAMSLVIATSIQSLFFVIMDKKFFKRSNSTEKNEM